jgi:hypothetical protein
MIDKGTNFSLKLPTLFKKITRATCLNNPLGSGIETDMDSWRRAFLFIQPPPSFENIEGKEFRDIKPVEELTEKFNLQHHENLSFNDIAAMTIKTIGELGSTLSPLEQRKRLQLINFYHCNSDYMNIEEGSPNLESYRGSSAVEIVTRQNKRVHLASVRISPTNTVEIHRRGICAAPIEVLPDSKDEASLVVREIAHRLYGKGGVCYDTLRASDKGIQAGIIPFSSKQRTLGVLLSEIMAASVESVRDLYMSESTVIYVDKYGRLVNYNGWVYSSRELCSPIMLNALIEILKMSQYHELQQKVATMLFEEYRNSEKLRWKSMTFEEKVSGFITYL